MEAAIAPEVLILSCNVSKNPYQVEISMDPKNIFLVQLLKELGSQLLSIRVTLEKLLYPLPGSGQAVMPWSWLIALLVLKM